MASPRRSQRQIRDAQNADRRKEMERAITEGRLVVRTMTPQEREQSDARMAAAATRSRLRRGTWPSAGR